MPHYVEGHKGPVPRGEHLKILMAVCGARYERWDSFSDVASLIDCELCRAWIREHESDTHRLKMIENSWKGPAATEMFWNDTTKRWDI